ncbi:hypothetical protein San01_21490 [Streptomyces angustmyceticus]|uniref:Uncharacterized protein n=1 Tax=Streptomyces angustmyceticus TaxID=285578 RepID=A0A5J4LBT7_9ACTN|nr:hypothetical protein San01_21490 [Streptomyces angustmyceticus]
MTMRTASLDSGQGSDHFPAAKSGTCPIAGRFLAIPLRAPQYRRVLERRNRSAEAPHEDLVDHLVRSTPLQRGEATRVVLDVLSYFDETTEEFVRRRHRELQSQGLRNEEIFERIRHEMPHRAVAPPDLSARQLRRLVYG